MKLYGLTGGIGSGKSTVARLFEERGVPIISSDRLNSLAAKSSEIKKQIFDRFGTTKRARLREIVFADPKERKAIEAIMHPEVQRRFFQKLNELAEQGHGVAIYESAIIFELGQESMFEAIIAVECPVEIRISRLLTREGLTEEIARNIINCQVSDEQRRAKADYVVVNKESMEELREQVDKIILQIADRFPRFPDSSD